MKQEKKRTPGNEKNPGIEVYRSKITLGTLRNRATEAPQEGGRMKKRTRVTSVEEWDTLRRNAPLGKNG
jgi:hypothetical protein